MVAPGDKYYSLCACVVASLATHIAKVQGSTRCIGPSASSALGVIVEAGGVWEQLVSVRCVYARAVDSMQFQYRRHGEAIYVCVGVSRTLDVYTASPHGENYVRGLLW